MARGSARASGLQPLFVVDWTGLSLVGPRLPLQSPHCCEPCGLKMLHIHNLHSQSLVALCVLHSHSFLLIALGLVPNCLLAADPLTMALLTQLGAAPPGCNPWLQRPGPV